LCTIGKDIGLVHNTGALAIQELEYWTLSAAKKLSSGAFLHHYSQGRAWIPEAIGSLLNVIDEYKELCPDI
jgi:hypothetical protein